MNQKQIVVIAGPTAVGKTEYTIQIARAVGGEVVSADSMQLYRFLDIGSAKPTASERDLVAHHLVDEIDPRAPWSVALYQKRAKECIADIHSRGKIPIVSGGTGLYVNALLYDMDFSQMPRKEGFRESLEQLAAVDGATALHERLRALDQDAAARIHENNIKKVIRAIEICENTDSQLPNFAVDLKKNNEYDAVLIGLTRDREELYRRIDDRVELLIKAGLFEEVAGLLSLGLKESDISMKGIGYKEIIGHFEHRYDREEAIRLIKRNTRHYAKRQLTWFRRYETMQWFSLSSCSSTQEGVDAVLDYLTQRLRQPE